ncbi:MAG: hypothetical protein WDW38_007650 [Sanguina aurantia]
MSIGVINNWHPVHGTRRAPADQQPLKRSGSNSIPAAYYSPTSSRPAHDNAQDPAHCSVNPWAAVADGYPHASAHDPSYPSTQLNLSSSFEDPTVEIDLGNDPPHVDTDNEAASPISTSSTSHDGGTPSKLARKSSSSTGAGSSSGGEPAAAALSSTQNRGLVGPAVSATPGAAVGQAKASLATDARGLLMAGGSSLFGAVVGGAGGSVFNAASSVFKHVASHVAGGEEEAGAGAGAVGGAGGERGRQRQAVGSGTGGSVLVRSRR